MGCYHPKMVLIERGHLRKDGKWGSKAITIINPTDKNFKGYEFYLKENERIKKDSYYGGEIPKAEWKMAPCGVCIGCRAKERKDWAIRIELEAKKYEHNYFVTLTYNQEHLPIPDEMENQKTHEIYINPGTWKGTLVKEHLSQFIKSFRNYLYRNFNKWEGLKFYACGEYGSDLKTSRPHYHIILMNCPKLNLEPTGEYNKKTGDPYYTNKRIEKIWGKGMINIGEATWDSISYTAGYTNKKLFGNLKYEHHAQRGQIPIFSNMSRRPGIGNEYFKENKWDIYELDEIINSKGQSIKPPGYFDKLMDQEEHEYLELKKLMRSRFSQSETDKKMKLTQKTLQEQLLIDEQVAEAKQKIYNRNRIK